MFADVQERNTLLLLCPLLEWLATVPTGWKKKKQSFEQFCIELLEGQIWTAIF